MVDGVGRGPQTVQTSQNGEKPAKSAGLGGLATKIGDLLGGNKDGRIEQDTIKGLSIEHSGTAEYTHSGTVDYTASDTVGYTGTAEYTHNGKYTHSGTVDYTASDTVGYTGTAEYTHNGTVEYKGTTE